jgi:L-2-hydroxyglutarate oxidase
MSYDFAIVGGGIVGLSVGMALADRFDGAARILLLEKEDHFAAHQTGHNSGVIHSGIYYKPGSLKARFAVEGSRLIPEFCARHNIAHDVCGKVIVATESWELPLLDALYQRGFANGLAVKKISGEQIKELRTALPRHRGDRGAVHGHRRLQGRRAHVREDHRVARR